RARALATGGSGLPARAAEHRRSAARSRSDRRRRHLAASICFSTTSLPFWYSKMSNRLTVGSPLSPNSKAPATPTQSIFWPELTALSASANVGRVYFGAPFVATARIWSVTAAGLEDLAAAAARKQMVAESKLLASSEKCSTPPAFCQSSSKIL